MTWLQAISGPDFISSDALLNELPIFSGNLFLDIGPLLGTSTGPASGYVGFIDLRVAQVPEPPMSSLLLVGILAIALTVRRRTVG
jgi:hypothetical protein